MVSPGRPPWFVLADEFSWQGWRHEGAQRIRPPRRLAHRRSWRRWLHRPEAYQPELVLIESAWEGFRRLDDRFTLPVSLARALRAAGVPVIFWNKEDPLHFERFLPIAQASDIVLTSDAACIGRYREAGCRGPVEVLTFPVQPTIHRQYLPKDEAHPVFFAGTWRPHHSERQQGFRDLILPALDHGLHIFSRRGEWPLECRPRIVGSFPYLELLVRTSAYPIALSISSVKDSPTMFPRRVVEMVMANILVISDRCRAIGELFPEIPQSDGPARTHELIAHFRQRPGERQAIVDAVKARLFRESTYEKQYFRLRDLARGPRG
ncbi:MAG TPA: glycosyltransferase [Thermoanaerobaculia bacterium]|jgi:hypothetical protein|nr:glycosyltransferase [Thermoanaerobaculia bacterium]